MTRVCIILILVAAVLSIFSAPGSHADVIRTLTESFDSPGGTDNAFDALIAPGNGLDSDFSNPKLPPTWGKQSGLVYVGPDYGGALWMARDPSPSPTGYYFTGSFMIVKDDLMDGEAITLFVSKPDDWTGSLAAWRLYFHKQQGQLALVLVVGLDTEKNNPSGAVYVAPLTPGRPYDVIIDYDTSRRLYAWYLDGQLQTLAAMPDDYPLIGTKIIGSSGSSNGRNSIFIVDNVSWHELPATLPQQALTAAAPELTLAAAFSDQAFAVAIPEPAPIELLAGALVMFWLWVSVPRLRLRRRSPSR